MIKFFVAILIFVLIEKLIEQLMGWKSTIWLNLTSAILFISIVNPAEVIKSIRKEKKVK